MRPSRIDILGDGKCFVHLICRCIDGQHFFKDEIVKIFIYQLLLFFKELFKITVLDYVIMDNHIHLILYVESRELLSKFMQMVLSRLAVFINKRLKRSGRVFGERPKTPVIQDKKYFINTMLYIADNPIRAGIVEKKKNYKWSGYCHYAYGKVDPLIDDAEEYLALSRAPALRRKKYQELGRMKAEQNAKRQPIYTTWFFIGDHDWIISMMISRGLRSAKKKPPD